MSEFPHTLKIATVWMVAGLTLFLGLKAYEHQQQRTRFEASGDRVTIRRAPDGHYHWPGSVNGVAVDFLVDTGATRTALPAGLAQEAGLQTEGRVASSTAGGVVTGARARADIRLDGGVQASRLPVVVLPQLDGALLGMDVLGRLRIVQHGNELQIDLREH
ncbi:retroviral-like aspartic protease family protein [Aquabacterium sp. A7-Y]|uniref:retropepsin-like aspartic protease family protein n=1 Tax=Aquabacterium sp. A7-Y TaxID=1349605 RepID=UPI00223D659E|nr:retropepsin-like aspartic protease [Aquabacterium sp. A7-Y]MCW7539609.1 retroviral-like aspartic protease family protein [Aquabacterium sp. A7-Y]